MLDVAVIGTGVTGCSVAYYLARYDLKVLLLDRHTDICEGTSKSNTAIVHAGHDAHPGTEKCRYNLEGNAMFDELCEVLEVPFRRNGILAVAQKNQHDELQKLYEQGKFNRVPGIEIVQGRRLHEMSPNLTDMVDRAIYLPSGGIVSPYELTIAMCENAVLNGAELALDTTVTMVQKTGDHFTICTTNGDYTARCVVNCAGVYADVIHNMISDQHISIDPRKGEYLIMDKTHGGDFDISICPLPIKKASGHTKGVWIAPTVSGNLLLGPTAVDQEDKEDTSNTQQGFAEILEKTTMLWPGLVKADIISSFAGLRAHCSTDDFIIGELKDCPGFFDCAGIASPGLTSAPAIGKKLAGDIAQRLSAQKRKYISGRDYKGLPFRYMSDDEKSLAIQQDPAYGRIVCRCEHVTEAEVRRSIRCAAGATTLDGVKRRTRAGMGRCQSGFCCTRVMQILHEELGVPMSEITKYGEGSQLITGLIWGGEAQ